jgi:hypothetical protein
MLYWHWAWWISLSSRTLRAKDSSYCVVVKTIAHARISLQLYFRLRIVSGLPTLLRNDTNYSLNVWTISSQRSCRFERFWDNPHRTLCMIICIANIVSANACRKKTNVIHVAIRIEHCCRLGLTLPFLTLFSVWTVVISTETFRGFPQLVHANSMIVTQIRTLLIPSTPSLTHHSLIILPFTASVNIPPETEFVLLLPLSN